MIDYGPKARGEENGEEAPFYCPSCGRRWQYLRDCEGRPDAPHPATLVVSTDELSGDPEKHTPAPSVVQ